MSYNTRQKSAILKCINEIGNEHFTVDKLLSKLIKKDLTVGRTTVYRMLERLANEGALRKYTASQGESVCYQYVENKDNCHEHFHLKCEKCGNLIHLDCDEISELHEHIKLHHGFNVNPLKTVIYGVCKGCAK